MANLETRCTNTFACNSAKFLQPLASTTDAGNVSFMKDVWDIAKICDQNMYAI